MGFLATQTRSKFFNELNEDERKKFFNLKTKNFLHQIDTFYYSVTLYEDVKTRENLNVTMMLNYLNTMRDFLLENKEEPWIDEDSGLKYTFGSHASIYKHRISINGFLDIYIAETIPNDNTNRIHVQLRSIALWELGEKEALSLSFNILRKFLSNFGLVVKRVRENRIDYCYHTNSIQRPKTYFGDSFLEKSLSTTFKKGNKSFDIVSYNDEEVKLYGKRCYIKYSYILLGSRSSDNVVFRTYNKAKEVIEENYKAFFIQRWLDTGVINYYDYLIYTEAFKNRRYETIEFDMANFYIEYGKDNSLRIKLKRALDNPNITLKEVQKLIKGVVPYPTVVLNFEYQTMRKFYKKSESLISSLEYNSNDNDDNINIAYLSYLYSIIDNRKIFLNYLTKKTVSFKKLCPDSDNEKDIYLDFWYRLRNTKIQSLSSMDLCREYQDILDISKQYNKIDNAIATISVIKGLDGTYNEDAEEILSFNNDNDVKRKDEYYNKLKEKKKKAQKSMKQLSPSQPIKLNIL